MIPKAGRVLTPIQYGATPPSGKRWPLNRDDPSQYAVNRLYPTVQGEGANAGRAMTIVRLQGCPVGCVWCDTPESWAEPSSALRGVGFTYLDAEGIARRVNAYPPRWALVTGGEPLWHNLTQLTEALRRYGLNVALETSGTYPMTGDFDWVCVSPKPAGLRPISRVVLARADEIKWIVGRPGDVTAFEEFLKSCCTRGTTLSVQPVSGSRRATALCLDAVMAHPEWRLSLQTHKYLGIA